MRNPTYEQALTMDGFQWTYDEAVLMEDINVQKGLNNQARLEQALDPELVAVYVRAKKDGAQFPPVVLWRPGKGKWIPIDGNHRLAADLQLKEEMTDAYLVQTDDQQLADRLTWTFNNKVNGRRLSPTESLQHAVSFVRKYGWTARNAAKEWGVSETTVQRACRIEGVRDVLTARKVKLTNTMTDHHLERLSPLTALGEDVLAQAATVVANSGIDAARTQELVAKVRKAKTQEDKRVCIDLFAKDEFVRQKAAETKGGTIKAEGRYSLPKNKLATALASMQRLLVSQPDKAAFRMTGAELEAGRDNARDVVAGLVEVFGRKHVLSAEDRKEVG